LNESAIAAALLGSVRMAAEFGELAGVPPQRACQLATREDFPKPAAVLGTGRGWRRGDLERWIEGWGRVAPRPPKRRRRSNG
jgi:hypothetical protein